MDRIEYLADLTVKRGCGFALLAIATVMVGVSAYRAKMRAHQAELAKSAAACGTRLAGDTAGATLAKASVNCEQR